MNATEEIQKNLLPFKPRTKKAIDKQNHDELILFLLNIFKRSLLTLTTTERRTKIMFHKIH